MTTAELVNRIIEKLGGNRVRFEEIGDEIGVIFTHAGNCYAVTTRGLVSSVFRFDQHRCWTKDSYSQWIEGVLNGKVRDEAGVLS
jgi:hypothetical protein